MKTRVTRWQSDEIPSQAALEELMQREGLKPHAWSNGPKDVYAAHSHGYNKVIYCVSGSIRFGLPDEDQSLTLMPGDRMELPAGVVHDAVVGPDGVVCLEAHL